jgi:hypothetical protein
LKKWAGNVEILGNCCSVLINLCVAHPKHQADVGDAGAMDVIVRTMRAYPKHAALQRQCVWVLATLASSVENRRKIVSAGGVERVIEAMRDLPSEWPVQWRGSMCLEELASNKDTREAIKQSNGVEVLEKVGVNHNGNVRVCEAAARALAKMHG